MFPFDPPGNIRKPKETSENQRFSNVFRGIKRENWEEKG